MSMQPLAGVDIRGPRRVPIFPGVGVSSTWPRVESGGQSHGRDVTLRQCDGSGPALSLLC